MIQPPPPHPPNVLSLTFVFVLSGHRKDFVEAYLLYVFSDSVSEQYSAFSSGFLKVCGGEILSLFQPSELMAMVVGSNNYNWEEMEKVSGRSFTDVTVLLLLLQEEDLNVPPHPCLDHCFGAFGVEDVHFL